MNKFQTVSKIKAIFFDIDGTLVSFKTHRMPVKMRRTLDRLREKGILTFVATGRHPDQTTNLGEWKPDGCVTLNGGYCTVKGEVVHRRTIEQTDICALADRIERGGFFPFAFVGEKGFTMNYADDRVRESLALIDLPLPRMVSPHQLRRMEVLQILGFFDGKDEAEVMSLMPNCHATRWTPLFTDIIPSGSCKWAGISKIIERFGITPAEVMAFGDGGNDLDMLEGAGTGIAMGNAAQEVKNHADYVTTSVDRDGITKALEHFGVL